MSQASYPDVDELRTLFPVTKCCAYPQPCGGCHPLVQNTSEGLNLITDLQALGAWCREHSAYFVVDGIQSLGVLPMDVQAWST